MTGNKSLEEGLLEAYQIRLQDYIDSDRDKNWPDAREITINQYKKVIEKLIKDLTNEG